MMAAPVETRSGDGWWDTIRSIVSLSYDPIGIRGHAREYRARVRAFDPARRPEGWSGHWSPQYGRIFARTFERYPPFDRSARDMPESAPRPMNEAVDPIVSSAELTDRDGHRLPWAPERSTTYDLLGWAGFAVGVVLFSIAAFSVAARVLGLPPLFPPAQEQRTVPADGIPVSPLQQTNPADGITPPNSAVQRPNPADEKTPPNMPAQGANPAEQKTAPSNVPAKRSGPDKIPPWRQSPSKIPRS